MYSLWVKERTTILSLYSMLIQSRVTTLSFIFFIDPIKSNNFIFLLTLDHIESYNSIPLLTTNQYGISTHLYTSNTFISLFTMKKIICNNFKSLLTMNPMKNNNKALYSQETNQWQQLDSSAYNEFNPGYYSIYQFTMNLTKRINFITLFAIVHEGNNNSIYWFTMDQSNDNPWLPF